MRRGRRILSRKDRAPIKKPSKKKHRIRTIKDRQRQKAFMRVKALLLRSANWKNRHAILADQLIKIAAEEGIPIMEIKDNFLRRLGDVRTLATLEKRLEYLGKTRAQKTQRY